MNRRRTVLIVDPIACDGHGVCAELLPESIWIDPWGFPVIDTADIPPHLIGYARRAVESCPRLALTLVERNT
jgi:ferredoxin